MEVEAAVPVVIFEVEVQESSLTVEVVLPEKTTETSLEVEVTVSVTYDA